MVYHLGLNTRGCEQGTQFKLSHLNGLIVLLGSQEPLEDLLKCTPRRLFMLQCAS